MKAKGDAGSTPHAGAPASAHAGRRLDIVLKADTAGSVEAAAAALEALSVPGVDISVIQRGVGDISKSDVFVAGTASGLILGFQVGAAHEIEKDVKDHRAEVRLYSVIYDLTRDVKEIAESMAAPVPGEQTVGLGSVIALFKSSRKGQILGCQVTKGFFSVGQHFRIVAAMGPVYTGIIESMHKEDLAIQKAMPGQKVGIKIKDFNRAKIGDVVESFRPASAGNVRPWEPSGKVIRR